MPPTTHDDARTTYLALRLAMPVLVLLLAFAILIRLITTGGCLQTSISAYYYTPLRSLFVASLCAIGTCLVIYRGRALCENALLNVSGVMAFVVAFEPTEIGPSACDTSNTPTDAQIFDATSNNVLALLGAGLVVIVLASGLALFTNSRGATGRLRSTSSTDARAALVGALGVALPVAVVAAFFFADFSFFTVWGHLGAAVSLFAAIVAVVVLNCLHPSTPRWSRRIYAALALVMALSASLLLTKVVPNYVFWAESLLIGLFAVYWIVQTIDLETRRAE